VDEIRRRTRENTLALYGLEQLAEAKS
jgi:hypothetical protein